MLTDLKTLSQKVVELQQELETKEEHVKLLTKASKRDKMTKIANEVLKQHLSEAEEKCQHLERVVSELSRDKQVREAALVPTIAASCRSACSHSSPIMACDRRLLHRLFVSSAVGEEAGAIYATGGRAGGVYQRCCSRIRPCHPPLHLIDWRGTCISVLARWSRGCPRWSHWLCLSVCQCRQCTWTSQEHCCGDTSHGHHVRRWWKCWRW